MVPGYLQGLTAWACARGLQCRAMLREQGAIQSCDTIIETGQTASPGYDTVFTCLRSQAPASKRPPRGPDLAVHPEAATPRIFRLCAAPLPEGFAASVSMMVLAFNAARAGLCTYVGFSRLARVGAPQPSARCGPMAMSSASQRCVLQLMRYAPSPSSWQPPCIWLCAFWWRRFHRALCGRLLPACQRSPAKCWRAHW